MTSDKCMKLNVNCCVLLFIFYILIIGVLAKEDSRLHRQTKSFYLSMTENKEMGITKYNLNCFHSTKQSWL